MNDSLSLSVDKRDNNLLASNMSVLEVLDNNESVGIFYNFIPTSEKESNYFKVTYKEAIENYKNGQNLKKSKNIIDLGIITAKFLITFLDDLINSILNSSKTSRQLFISSNKEPSPSTNKKANNDICKTQIIICAKSDKKEREKQLSIATCNSFDEITEDNKLLAKKIKKKINVYSTIINDV